MTFSTKETELENTIRSRIGLPSEEIQFIYSDLDGRVILEVFTINSRHSQRFLYHSEEALTIEDALKKMFDYVEEHCLTESSYTIQWIDINNPKQFQTSYFRGKDLFTVLEKFYYGRDKTASKIFSIQLNPVS